MRLACLSHSCRENFLKSLSERREISQSILKMLIILNSLLLSEDKEDQKRKMVKNCLRQFKIWMFKSRTKSWKFSSTPLTPTGFSKLTERKQIKILWSSSLRQTRTRSIASSIFSQMQSSALRTSRAVLIKKCWSKLSKMRTTSLIQRSWETPKSFASGTFWKRTGNSSVTLKTLRGTLTITSTKSCLESLKAIKLRALKNYILKSDF